MAEITKDIKIPDEIAEEKKQADALKGSKVKGDNSTVEKGTVEIEGLDEIVEEDELVEQAVKVADGEQDNDEPIKLKRRDISLNGKDYVLKYTTSRVEMIEDALGESVEMTFIQKRAFLTTKQAKVYFALGLKFKNGGHVQQEQGIKIATALLESKEFGRRQVIDAITEAIYIDMGFLFPNASS